MWKGTLRMTASQASMHVLNACLFQSMTLFNGGSAEVMQLMQPLVLRLSEMMSELHKKIANEMTAHFVDAK